MLRWCRVLLLSWLAFFPARAALAAEADPMLIVAHRGASNLAPENTLASVKLAWKLGADGVECDVFLSADGRVVVIHDPYTGRTAGEWRKVDQSSFSELRALDVGRWKGAEFARERIPALEDLLETLPAGKHLLVEVKSGPEILDQLDSVLRRSGKRAQVVLMSFRLEVLALAEMRWPELPTIWLKKAAKRYPSCERIAHDPSLIELARRNRVDGLGVEGAALTGDFARAVKQAGMKLFVWTVDDPAAAREMRAWGADALITNRPGWMRTQLGL
ncbi:MAG: glycerophosphodiester phosphodiesterase [Deltaproteobacteria bacterium]|nr:glycerophosphodiester phosphodiesterase [Deltaproteobacteria bacterium]